MLETWNLTGDNKQVPKLFVFAAGGSGMRVAEALTILAASGYLDDSKYEIVPILVDFDLQNGNLLRAERCLELYTQLNQRNDNTPFFRHDIRPLYRGDRSFLFDMELGNESLFEKYHLQYLFSEDEKLRELTESLLGGITESDSVLLTPVNEICSFGCAPFNVARMLLGDLSMKDDFSKLYNEVGSGDVFVVVGAIHGYTGSAAIFSLAHVLNLYFRAIPKAAVLILPPSVPAHDTWEDDEMVIMAKGSLRFFTEDGHVVDKYDRVYYQDDNCLSAALAIADFIKKTEGGSRDSKDSKHLLSPGVEPKTLEDSMGRFFRAMKDVREEETCPELKQFAELFFKWTEMLEIEVRRSNKQGE